MKTINLIVCLLVSLPCLVWAQSSPYQQFYEKYAGQEGYTSIHITPHMFNLFKKLDTDAEKGEFEEVVKSLTSIKMLVADSTTLIKNHSFNKQLSALQSNNYKELMQIQDGSEKITFLMNEKAGKISEFVMIIKGSETVLISLEGNMDLEQISKLSKSINIDGLQHVDKIDNK